MLAEIISKYTIWYQDSHAYLSAVPANPNPNPLFQTGLEHSHIGELSHIPEKNATFGQIFFSN